MTPLRTLLAGLLAGTYLTANAAGYQLCFVVEDDNPNGSGTLQLATMDVGSQQLVSGRLRVDLVQQNYSVNQVLRGALVPVDGGYKLSLRGTDFERSNHSENAHTWQVGYHADLDSSMNSGALAGIMRHFGPDHWQQEYLEATLTAVACP